MKHQPVLPTTYKPDTRLCADCGGKLADDQGVFYERVSEVWRTAKVVFVCRACKVKA